MPDLSETLNAPCCRRCGSTDLRSIERSISWRPVNFEADAQHGWLPGDDWGDDSGDDDAASVGIVCANCYAQVAAPGYAPDAPWNARELVTTTGAYGRSHPVRSWWVQIHARDFTADAMLTRRYRVLARDERGAAAAGAARWYSGQRRGSIFIPIVWPVGSTRPAKAAA